MMNAKRYTGCRCCVDPEDVARRQIEKREWQKDVEKEMTDETIWVDGPNGKIPYNIQTQAGREIWTEINQKGGSIYWGPLGKALPLVEAEAMRMAEERILARLEEWKTDDCGNCPRCAANREIIWIVKGENE